MQDRVQDVMSVAADLFSRKPEWLEFHREVFGVDGAIRKAFPTAEELAKFEGTDEYDQLEKMMVKLREDATGTNSGEDVTRVITVRMPSHIHETLKEEAQERRLSINRLCLAKLTQRLIEVGSSPRQAVETNQPAVSEVS